MSKRNHNHTEAPADLVLTSLDQIDIPASCYSYVMTDADADILDADLEPYFDIRNGEVLAAYLGIYADNTAELTGFFEQAAKFNWKQNENGSLSLDSDSMTALLYFYKSGPQSYELYWAKLEIDTYAIWFQIF